MSEASAIVSSTAVFGSTLQIEWESPKCSIHLQALPSLGKYWPSPLSTGALPFVDLIGQHLGGVLYKDTSGGNRLWDGCSPASYIFIVWWRMVQSCALDWLGMVVGRSGSSFLIQNWNRVALRTKVSSGNLIGLQQFQAPQEWKLVKRPCFESNQLNKAVAVFALNCRQFTETSWKGADFHLNWFETGSHNDQLTVNCFMASLDRDHVTYASIINHQ